LSRNELGLVYFDQYLNGLRRLQPRPVSDEDMQNLVFLLSSQYSVTALD
jgi:hypothetical protein